MLMLDNDNNLSLLCTKYRYRLPFKLSWLALFIAWSGVAFSNINGPDTQNFNSTESGKDFTTVYSSQMLGQGNYSLGLFLNYAVNTLPYFDDVSGKSNDGDKKYNDGLVASEVHAAFGVLPYLDLGVTLPAVLYQDVKNNTEFHGQFAKNGLTGAKISSKLHLWSNEKVGFAMVLSADFNSIDSNPFAGSDSNPTINTEFVADTKIRNFTLAANIGYRFISSGNAYVTSYGDTPIVPTKNETIGSMAVQYQIPGTNTQILSEIYGSSPSNDFSNVSPRSSDALEIIGGVRHYFTPDLAGHAGAGSELIHGLNTPAFRVYAGFHWMPTRAPKKEPVQTPPPPAPVVITRAPDKTFVIRDILFKFNSTEISNDATSKSLGELADAITDPSKLEKLVIEGHTCSIGTDQYNKKLSMQRAQSIKNWLVTYKHVPAAKIFVIGMGKSTPLATNKTPQGRKLNRRVEFKVYYSKTFAMEKPAQAAHK